MTTVAEIGATHPAPATPEPGRTTWAPIVTAAVVALGSLWRVGQWWSNPSLWLDEASIADNIVDRGYGSLTQPLSYEQGAPVGWLWIERSMSLLLGDSERALRLWPMVAGIATILVAWALARRVLGPIGTASFVAAVAFWPALVQYTGELKQYSTDTLASLIILLLGVRVLQGERHARAHLALAGTILLWCSHPALLCLAGVGIVIGVDDLRRRDRSGVALSAVTALLWSLSLAGLWEVSLEGLSGSELIDGWALGYAPPLSDPIGWVQFVRRETLSIYWIPTPGVRWLVSASLVVGAWQLLRRAPRVFALTASLPIVALVASQVKVYPYVGDRPSLYLFPVFLLWIASALPERTHDDTPTGPAETRTGPAQASTAARRRRAAQVVGAAVGATMVLSWMIAAHHTWWLINPFATRHEARDVLSPFADEVDDSTPTYLYRFSGTSYRYYGRRFDLPEPAGALRLAAADRRDPAVSSASACRGSLDLRGVRQIWVVYTFRDPLFPDDLDGQLATLRPLGEVQQTLRAPGAAAIEVRLAPGADQLLCRLDGANEGLSEAG